MTVELCQLMCGFNCAGYSTTVHGDGTVGCTTYLGAEAKATAGDAATGGVWRQGVKCPQGNMGPNFRSVNGSLNDLKTRCAAACDADARCEKGALYYAGGTGTCYLHDSNCGDYE